MAYNRDVEDIQKVLTSYGYDVGTIDGWYGKSTKDALIQALRDTGNEAVTTSNKKSGFVLSKESISKLLLVHPDLQKVVKKAIEISDVDFTVGEGIRSRARQKQLYAQGATKTMNSRHLTGHAVDLIALDSDGKVSWAWPLYYKIADAMKEAAKDLNVDLEWGGDWKSFKDGPHYQLSWKSYNA